MIDLEKKDMSIKVGWVKKLLSPKPAMWKYLMYSRESISPSILFQCNVKYKHVTKMGLRFVYLEDMVKAWSLINYEYIPHTCTSWSQTVNECLWFNSNMKRQIYMPRLAKIGINSVEDLIENNCIYTHERFCECFQSDVNFLDFYRLVNSIPKNWTSRIRTIANNGDNITSVLEKVCSVPKPTKWYYTNCMNKDKYVDKARLRWSNELSITIPVDQWEMLRESNYYLTISTKLRYFQYRILSYKLVTNIDLYKWRKKENSKCTFCKTNEEVYKHLFFDCKYVKSFWTAVSRWVRYMIDGSFQLEFSKIMLNRYGGKNSKLLNTIILLAKHYIYVQRCKNESLNFCQFLYKVTELYNDEKYIALKNDKIKIHDEKWDKLQKSNLWLNSVLTISKSVPMLTQSNRSCNYYSRLF